MSPRTRVLYISQSVNQSINRPINQWIDQTEGSKSFNQSINLWVVWHFKWIQSINQLTAVSKSIFFLNRRGLQILIDFYTVLGYEKTNRLVRWGRGYAGQGEGCSEPGDWVFVWGFCFLHFMLQFCVQHLPVKHAIGKSQHFRESIHPAVE